MSFLFLSSLFHKIKSIITKKTKEKYMTERYITAFDPTINRRVLFIVRNGWAISVITGYKFRYRPRRR